MVTIADLIDEQLHSPAIVPHEHVGVSIVVDVAERSAAAYHRLSEHGSRSIGHLLEPIASKVPKQLRMLTKRKLVVFAGHRFEEPDRAVDRQQVEPAVVVEVDPGRAESRERQAALGQPALAREIVERSGPISWRAACVPRP